MDKKVLAIVQARTGSTRLPGKVLLPADGEPLLTYELKRIKRAKKISKIVVATTDKPEDDKIEELCRRLGVDCFRGSENDVLDRYYRCALEYPDYGNIMRLTGDCPLIDPGVIDRLIEFYFAGKYDFASNVGELTYPDGLDAEIFKRGILVEAASQAKLTSEREHVTQYFNNSPKIRRGNLKHEEDLSAVRLTVDNPEDYQVIKFLIEHGRPNYGFTEFVNLLKQHPEIMNLNLKIERNEGLAKSLKHDHK